MSKFRSIVESRAGSKYILQGNEAFALGVVHAGYHAADGYPGTPSTEVIDRSLAHMQDKMKVGWSVNEAVAVGVALGHSTAGYDAVVTMKIPGVFQAGDAISTAAFYSAKAGALVIYAATDYVPSSTQHVIDARYFFYSSRLPVLEPRNHQEMYEIAWTAADISREFNTPVVILASGILAHSEGMVTLKEPRHIEPKKIPETLHQWMLMPGIARENYNKATGERIPRIQQWAEFSNLVRITPGTDDFGMIVNGEAEMITREALNTVGLNPSILSTAISNPLPIERIKKFAGKVKGKLFIIEDGGKFLEERIRLQGINVIGKDELNVITDWTPEAVLQFLSNQMEITDNREKKTFDLDIEPVKRPPSICPGCPYRAFGLVVDKLKKKKKLYASFGDIGCSTLLYFLNALDTVTWMGGSDSMRQGFVLSRPDMVHQTISVIGDSCECHSGLDATRNAVFRNTPGVKVILDNRVTAMTGGQPAPSSKTNLEGVPNKFVLKEAVAAEKGRTITVDSYNLKEVEHALTDALKLAEKGEFTTLILEGPCIQETEGEKKVRRVRINSEKCKQCGLCAICPGIELDEHKNPHFTSFCSNCGSNSQVCMQQCPFEAIEWIEEEEKVKEPLPERPGNEEVKEVTIERNLLPESLRVAVRGIGGQGNLFFGKVLSKVALQTPYSETHIVKGDTHGMAQLGGAVISTFSCGNVYSPTLAPNSADVLVVMEISEVLRPGFLNLLKPGGKVLLNVFKAVPANIKIEDYPSLKEIEMALATYGCEVIKIDAAKIAHDLGDKTGKTTNVVVLGQLSTIAPFNIIPRDIWLSALMSVSPDDFIKSANQLAFDAGRKYL